MTIQESAKAENENAGTLKESNVVETIIHHPPNHHFDGFPTIPKWVVYGIVLTNINHH